MKKTLCCVAMSGGLDSMTVVGKAIENGFFIQPINFKYGQKHEIEVVAFENLVEFFKNKSPQKFLDPIEIDLTSLLGEIGKIYKNLRDTKKIEEKTGLEFYTPSRNLVFTSLAAMFGEIVAHAAEFNEVLIGIGIHKHSKVYKAGDYWDITPEFAQAFSNLISLNTAIDMDIFAPFVDKTKADVVAEMSRMKLPYKLSWTCYNPKLIREENGKKFFKPCNKCEACFERMNAGAAIGLDDINDYILEIGEADL